MDFDLDKTLYYFIAGRYEFGNKGADIFIESLARLNARLKQEKPDTTVVAFLIFPAITNNFNVESLRSHAVLKQLRETISRVQQGIGQRLFDSCLKGEMPSAEQLLTKDDMVKIKRCMYSMQRDTMPPVTTHNIVSTVNITQSLGNCPWLK